MIIDTLNNLMAYSKILPQIKSIYSYILRVAPCNEQSFLDDNETRAFFVENEKNEQHLFECHKECIDLVYIVSGIETMGIVSRDDATMVKPIKDDKEILCCEGNYSILKLKSGMFVILFPGEAHCPSINKGTDNDVKKIVFKIKHNKKQ